MGNDRESENVQRRIEGVKRNRDEVSRSPCNKKSSSGENKGT